MRWPWQKADREIQTQAGVEWAAEMKLTLNQWLEQMASQNQSISGISVDPTNALRCTAVYGVVRAMTNAISSYPVYVEKQTEAAGRIKRERVGDHALVPRLRRPNAVHTRAEFFSLAIKHVVLYGDFFALKGEGRTGPIKYLRPVENPDAVTVAEVDWGTGVTYKINQAGADQRMVKQDRVLHFTNGILADDCVTGISPVSKLKEAIAISIAAEELLSKLYGNNDVPPYAITTDTGFQSKEAYDLWRESFAEMRAKARESGTGALLMPPGVKVQELSFKPVDVMLVDVIKQKAREIFAGFGVPPHKVADLERATFSNIEELDLEFVRDTMEPHTTRFSESMARDLLTDADVRSGHRVVFDLEHATEGKFSERLEAYSKGFNVGVYSPNDIRAKLGENPREGGDDYYSPLNMGSSNDVPGDDTGAGDSDTDAGAEPAIESNPFSAVQ